MIIYVPRISSNISQNMDDVGSPLRKVNQLPPAEKKTKNHSISESALTKRGFRTAAEMLTRSKTKKTEFTLKVKIIS